jgi:hypothetical protein
MDDTSRGGDGTTFYRYRDAQGRPVLVDSLAKVPGSAKGSLESITLSPPRAGQSLSPSAITSELHWPSFAAGAACVIVLGLVFVGSRRVRSRAVRVGLSLAVLALGAAAYLGWARRLTGESEALLASPAALIQDARDAVQKMNERNREQQRVLQELEQEP